MSEPTKVSELISGYVMQNPCMFVDAGPLILSERINIRKMAADLLEARAALTLANQRAEAAEAERDETVAGAEYRRKLLTALETRCAAAEAERDALRKDARTVTDAMEAAGAIAYHSYLNNPNQTAFQNTRRLVREVIDAALAVQP